MFQEAAAVPEGLPPFSAPDTKACQRCKQVKAATEFHVRSDRPSGRQSRCKTCACEVRATWRATKGQLPEFKEAAKSRTAQWRQDNPSRWRANNKAWAAANPGHSAEAGTRYRERNPDARLKRIEKHPGIEGVYAASRRAAKIKATPPWADLAAIAEFYRLAKEKTESTGTEWNVDHIVPLKHKLVCGLHVPCNLQLLPAVENFRKGNRFSVT